MRKTTRSGITFLAIVGLAGLTFFAYNANRSPALAAVNSPAAGGNPGASPTAVEVVKVAVVDFLDEASAVGTLKSNESVVLRPEMAGRIATINFKDAALVNQGSVLITLDSAIQAAEMLQAQANLGLAETSFKRNQELVDKKFLSQQALDTSVANLKVHQAALQLAQAKLDKTRIKAPFGGMLGLRNVSLGDYVKEGQDLINLEDITTLRVDFKLPENALARVKLGQRIALSSDAFSGQAFTAVLDAIDPLVDQAGRAISVRARVDNAAGQLRPGMFVRVRVILGQRNQVLMLPEQAIMPGVQPAVFKIVDGHARRTTVKLGVRREAQVEVLAGLAVDDLVVSAGQMKLRDGAPVRAIGDASVVAPADTGKPAAPAPGAASSR